MAENIFSVENKVVCISGSSRGLGRTLAEGFIERGAKVVISSWDAEELAIAETEMKENGLNVYSVVADVSKREDCQKLVASTSNYYGSIDVMICNAGVDIIKPAIDYEETEWDKIIDINLRGAFYCAHFAAGEMLKNGAGSIIMTSTIAGNSGIPGLAPYAASKGGINQLVRTMAVEWAERGVRVNAVAPGYIDNDMKDVGLNETRDYRLRATEMTPMKRRGTLREFLGAYLFLASDAASYITGEILYVDGGYNAA